jgi:hypothetical protein
MLEMIRSRINELILPTLQGIGRFLPGEKRKRLRKT